MQNINTTPATQGMSLEDKVRTAREAGAQDWEIAAQVAHYPPLHREVQEILRLEEDAGPVFSEDEASAHAELLAPILGREPTREDVANIQNGQSPVGLRERMSELKQSLGILPISEFVPDNVENPEAVSDIIWQKVNTDRGALDIALREYARTAPDPDLEEDLRALDAAFAEHRTIRGQIQAELEGRTQMWETAYYDTDLLGEDSSFLGVNMNASEGTQLAGEFLPKTAVDTNAVVSALKAAGIVPDTWWERFKGNFAYGEFLEDARENLKDMPYQEQAQRWEAFKRHFLASAGPEWRTGLNAYWLSSDVVDERFWEENETDRGYFEWMLLNTVGYLGMVEAATLGVGAIFSRPVRGGIHLLTKSHAVTRLNFLQRPAAFGRALNRAFSGMPESAVNKYFNLSKIDIAQSALPGPRVNEPIVNIPDSIVNPREIARLEETTAAIQDSVRRMEANKFDAKERAQILDSVVNEIEAANVGRLRLASSEIEVFEDSSGVRLHMFVGADENHGFSSLDEALEYAQGEAKMDMSKTELWQVKADGTLEQVSPELINKDGVLSPKTPMTGEFYIKLKHDHIFSAEDARLFDGAPVVHGAWMGRFLGALSTPSAYLEGSVVGKFVRSYLQEQALTNQLDSLVAPLFRDLTARQRIRVNDALTWAQNHAAKNGQMPDADVLKNTFDLSPDEMRGFYTARHFQDTLWAIQNNRLYENWRARGFVTVGKIGTEGTYHGAPVSINEARKYNSFYDPESRSSRAMSSEDLKDFYARGGTIIRTELPVQGTKGAGHKMILVDKDTGWKTNKLSKRVLKYIPGYNTRIYEDAHFVQRWKKSANMDGKEEEMTATMRVASTAREARIFQRRAMNMLGRKLYKNEWNPKWSVGKMHKMLQEKGYDIRIVDDARLSDADRIQIDLQKMQVEGRLFFDDRLAKPLKDTYGNLAEIAAPIDSIQRTARMVARQVSTESLVATQKMQFFEKYKDLGLNPKATSIQIDAKLTSMISEKTKDASRRAAKARAWWRYIRFMEGTMNTSPTAFRRVSIAAGEAVDYFIGKKIGGRGFTKELARSIGRADAVAASKQLAFLHFLTARPLRQLVLQGMQHFNLQAIDLSYFGKWQMDTWSLLSAMKRLSRTREDAALYGIKRKQMANMMGHSDEEMEIITREFSQSGLVDTVDVHSYAGGQPKSAVRTPKTVIGRGASAVASTVEKPIHMARAMGFDLGEQFNVTASWLMALRRTMKENGFKSVKELDSQHWDDIANRGSQYALAMHKANAATWQYGLLSLPMQFLQFTHKWLLTSLGASTTMRKAGLGNSQFTVNEARRILAFQTVMWGGAGSTALFGLEGVLDNFINSFDPKAEKLSPTARQMLQEGLADVLVNDMIGAVVGDPDLNLALSDVFSPATGMQQLVERIVELGTEPFMAHEVVLGPSGQVFSRLKRAYQIGQAVVGKGFSHWEPGVRAQAVVEATAAGLFSGFDDLLRVRLAAKMGYWSNQAGVPIEIEPTWTELVAKGALGLNSDRLIDYHKYVGEIGDLAREMRQNAKEHAERVQRIVTQWGDGQMAEADALANLETLGIVYELYKEDGLGEAYYAELRSQFEAIATPDQQSIFKKVVALVMAGYTGDIVTDLLQSGNLTPEQADELRKWLDRAMADQETVMEKRGRLFEGERDLIQQREERRQNQ